MSDEFPQDKASANLPRVLIVSEHASTRFGGEAILPWHYFRLLAQRGADVHMIVHERSRSDLLAALPANIDAARIHFISDSSLNVIMWKLGRFLPQRIAYITLGAISRLQTQLAARVIAKRLIRDQRIDVVHQPIPVSPREPSALYGLGVPVVIGPMNGNMSYPLGFIRGGSLRLTDWAVKLGRSLSDLLNNLLPGKLRAAVLLVANQRTKEGLPSGVQGNVISLVENGVDLTIWKNRAEEGMKAEITKFIYVGRLVDWKRVDLLLEALVIVSRNTPAQLRIVGNGPLLNQLEAQTQSLGIADNVIFSGWKSQPECAQLLCDSDVFVLPSIFECGGAVVLEAMACGIPVIATNWGGPADYIDANCGVLVDPISPDQFRQDLANAMLRLANNPQLCRSLAQAGRTRAERDFDWQVKIDQILEIYAGVLGNNCE